jgi:GntR family transcriptional regulator/MocR family aminotransferase
MKKQTIMEAKPPHYQRIARQLKSAIERGELTPGSRLPASRVYAQEQGVSRATIENAWGELVAQGWLERRGQAGTFVSERLSPRQLAPVPPARAEPDGAAAVSDGAAGAGSLSARPVGAGDGAAAADAVAVRPCARRSRRRSACRAIVDYLRLSRSIDCQPEQVLITGNYAASMRLILRTLAQPASICGWRIRGFPDPAGREAEGAGDGSVPVDDEGMDVGWGSGITRAHLRCSPRRIRARWAWRCRWPGAASCWRGRRARRVDY